MFVYKIQISIYSFCLLKTSRHHFRTELEFATSELTCTCTCFPIISGAMKDTVLNPYHQLYLIGVVVSSLCLIDSPQTLTFYNMDFHVEAPSECTVRVL